MESAEKYNGNSALVEYPGVLETVGPFRVVVGSKGTRYMLQRLPDDDAPAGTLCRTISYALTLSDLRKRIAEKLPGVVFSKLDQAPDDPALYPREWSIWESPARDGTEKFDYPDVIAQDRFERVVLGADRSSYSVQRRGTRSWRTKAAAASRQELLGHFDGAAASDPRPFVRSRKLRAVCAALPDRPQAYRTSCAPIIFATA
jgi:hypothetical protein